MKLLEKLVLVDQYDHMAPLRIKLHLQGMYPLQKIYTDEYGQELN